MCESEDVDGNIRPLSWFWKRGIRPHRFDGRTASEWRKGDVQERREARAPRQEEEE